MTIETRTSREKAEPILLDAEQIAAIKDQPDTPTGRHDRLLICLALNHGLQVSELALLERGDFNLEDGTMTFERPGTGYREMHKLTDETLKAARNYIAADAPKYGNIWRTSLLKHGMSSGEIIKRIGLLGKVIGIDNLTPNDLRHTWAQAFHMQPFWVDTATNIFNGLLVLTPKPRIQSL